MSRACGGVLAVALVGGTPPLIGGPSPKPIGQLPHSFTSKGSINLSAVGGVLYSIQIGRNYAFFRLPAL
jgi:hypothetical protein